MLLMLPIYFHALDHWLSVNENLCLIDGVEKVVGWNPLWWNRLSPVLYPPYNPPPFHLLSTHLTNPCLKMGQCLEIEKFGWKYNSNIDSLLGMARSELLSRLARTRLMCPPTTLKLNLMLEPLNNK